MSVTITTTRLSETRYLLSFKSTLSDPTFYIYRDGILVTITKQNWWKFEVYSGAMLQIEVKDDDSEPSAAWPGQVLISWERDAEAVKYYIQKYVGSAWVTERIILDGSLYHWTPYLEDETTYHYRVVPIDENETAGQSREFAIVMVRRPNVPSVTITYDAETHNAIIEAA